MNKFLMLYVMGLMEEAVAGLESGGGGGAVVADAPAAPPSDPATPPDAPAAPPDAPSDDLLSQLDSLLPKDETPAAPDPNAPPVTPEVPEQLQAALGISEFVTAPEHINTAIQAADEVWKVATGQLPARQLLEGFRSANPQQYQAIAQDLAGYLTEQGLIQAPQSPLEGLKSSRPDVYNAIADFVQKQTGKPLDAPADPYHARLSAIEQSIAAEQEAQQIATWNAQVDAARQSATEWMTKTLTNTFADGMADRYVAPNGLLWQKAQAMQIAPEKVMQELAAGKFDTLQKLWKAVEKDEAAVIRKFNANLVKQHNTLRNAVPASKGGSVRVQQNSEFPPQQPGESTVDYGVRLMRMGKK